MEVTKLSSDKSEILVQLYDSLEDVLEKGNELEKKILEQMDAFNKVEEELSNLDKKFDNLKSKNVDNLTTNGAKDAGDIVREIISKKKEKQDLLDVDQILYKEYMIITNEIKRIQGDIDNVLNEEEIETLNMSSGIRVNSLDTIVHIKHTNLSDIILEDVSTENSEISETLPNVVNEISRKFKLNEEEIIETNNPHEMLINLYNSRNRLKEENEEFLSRVPKFFEKKDTQNEQIINKNSEQNEENTVTSDYDTDIKILGKIVIHYYDKETKEKLAKDIEKTDLIGNQYVSEEKEFKGYKLVSKPESNVHIYKEKKQEFSYEYEKIDVDVYNIDNETMNQDTDSVNVESENINDENQNIVNINTEPEDINDNTLETTNPNAGINDGGFSQQNEEPVNLNVLNPNVVPDLNVENNKNTEESKIEQIPSLNLSTENITPTQNIQPPIPEVAIPTFEVPAPNIPIVPENKVDINNNVPLNEDEINSILSGNKIDDSVKKEKISEVIIKEPSEPTKIANSTEAKVQTILDVWSKHKVPKTIIKNDNVVPLNTILSGTNNIQNITPNSIQSFFSDAA